MGHRLVTGRGAGPGSRGGGGQWWLEVGGAPVRARAGRLVATPGAAVAAAAGKGMARQHRSAHAAWHARPPCMSPRGRRRGGRRLCAAMPLGRSCAAACTASPPRGCQWALALHVFTLNGKCHLHHMVCNAAACTASPPCPPVPASAACPAALSASQHRVSAMATAATAVRLRAACAILCSCACRLGA